LIGHGLVEGLTKRDYSGAAVDNADVVKDLALNIIPMGIRSNSEQTVWDSMLTSIGLKTKKATPELQREIMMEYYRQNPKRQTGEQKEKSQFKRELRDFVQSNPNDKEGINAKIIEGLEKNYVNPNEIDKIAGSNNKQLNNGEYLFQRLDKDKQEEFLSRMDDNELRIYLPYARTDVLERIKEINPGSEYVLQTDPTLDVSLNYKVINKKIQDLTDEARLYEGDKNNARYKEIAGELQKFDAQMKEIKKTDFYKNKLAKTKEATKETKGVKKDLLNVR
jgi:hypothetical protein